jgi:hypothetical protein
MVGVGVSVIRPSSCTEPTSASISIGRPASRSCSIEVRCAPTAAPPSIRRSTSMGNLTPSFSAISCASSIMLRATPRVPGIGAEHVERGMGQRRDRVERQVAPELHPDLVAEARPTGAFSPAADSAFDSAIARSDFDPSGSPSEKRLPSICLISPRLGHLRRRDRPRSPAPGRGRTRPIARCPDRRFPAACPPAARRSCGNTTTARRSRRRRPVVSGPISGCILGTTGGTECALSVTMT